MSDNRRKSIFAAVAWLELGKNLLYEEGGVVGALGRPDVGIVNVGQ